MKTTNIILYEIMAGKVSNVQICSPLKLHTF